MDEEQLTDLMKRMYIETYAKGWDSCKEHLRNQLVRNILSDGVISTNVDVDHLERIVRIIEATE